MALLAVELFANGGGELRLKRPILPVVALLAFGTYQLVLFHYTRPADLTDLVS